MARELVGRSDRHHYLKSTSRHARDRTHQKWVQSQLGPGAAGPLQGLQEVVISSGQTPLDQDVAPWKVTGSWRPHCVCLSQTDYLILLGPALPEHRVLFTAPMPNQSLIHTVEDYSCSFATSSPTCHDVSLGRHPHSCIKAIQFLLHGNNWGGWKPHRPPRMSWKRTPTRAHLPQAAAGRGRLH